MHLTLDEIRWQFEVNNKVLIQSFFGSWNEQAMLAYIPEFRKTVAPLVAQGNWAILSLFERWDLGTADIVPHVEQHCRWFIERGVSHDCHVYPKDLVKNDQLERMIPVSENSYHRQVFTEIAQAKAWLASNGFKLNSSRLIQDYIQN